jgi:hypothetical protein
MIPGLPLIGTRSSRRSRHRQDASQRSRQHRLSPSRQSRDRSGPVKNLHPMSQTRKESSTRDNEWMLERARKRLRKRAKRGLRRYPVATVALYGPDCDPAYFRTPDGETYDDFAARIATWLAEQDRRSVIAVTHGIVTRVMRGLYAGLPRATALSLPVPQDRIFHLAGGTIAPAATHRQQQHCGHPVSARCASIPNVRIPCPITSYHCIAWRKALMRSTSSISTLTTSISRFLRSAGARR